MITIEIDKKGIKRVVALEGSVAESQENSDLLRATALPRQLLHNSVVEAFGGLEDTTPELDEPRLWVPTDRDGDIDVPREIVLKTNVLPRGEYECVPAWFVEGVKTLFPNEDWNDNEELTPKGKLHSTVDPETGETIQIREVDPNAPLCTRTEEQAVDLFYSYVEGLDENYQRRMGRESILVHYGWVGECDGNDTMVSEPFCVDLDGMTKFCALCNQLGWNFKIKGISGHYPGSTVRLEIRPKGHKK